MKRFVAVFLMIVLTVSVFCTSAVAFERPVGGSTVGVTELEAMTVAPDLTTNIALYMTASPFMSSPMLNPGTTWSDAKNAVSAAKLGDIGNQFKYGFSFIGGSHLNRGASAATDGYWAVGETGAQNTLQFATSRQNGGFEWITSGNYYNEKGEVAPEGKGADDGYRYTVLLTCNFGEVANITGFGYVTVFVSTMAYPIAADLYVSDDGVNWTLVGYYDRTARLMEGRGDYATVPGTALGQDASGNVHPENKHFSGWVLPEGTKGQFFRIAATSPFGQIPTDPGNYDSYTAPFGTANSIRELFVFGTKTGEVKTPWQDPADDPYLQATQTTAPVTLPSAPSVTTAPADQKTDEPKTNTPEMPSEAPVNTGEPTPGTTENNGEKKGCGASVGIAAVVMTAAVGALAIRRRKEN